MTKFLATYCRPATYKDFYTKMLRYIEILDINVKFLGVMILIAVSAVEASAQENRRLDNDIRKNMLEAYDYRKDISREVLAMTKKWPDKYGILHDDWIENTNGRSIMLTGEVILPQYDYTQLELYSDSLYVMKVGSRRGVVARSGRMVVPFNYWKLNFKRICEGLIFGQQNAAGTGKVDVYTTEGQKVCEMDNVQFIDAFYISHKNMVVVSCKHSNEKEEHEYLYFPDGTAITDDNLDDGGQHPRIPRPNDDERNQIDYRQFQENVWVKLFRDYYDKKKYNDALYCISFYDQHDRQALCSDSSIPNFITFTSILDCYKRLGMYELLVNTVENRTIDHRLPRGLVFNLDNKQVESTREMLYSDVEQNYLLGMVNDINEIYRNSLVGSQASVQQRQQRAQMWMTVMAATAQAVTTTITNLAAENRSSSASRSGENKHGNTSGKAAAPKGHDGGGNSISSEKEDAKPVDTSRIDAKIKDLEESLRKAEMREAKEHSTTTVIEIQSLRDNIKDLQKYRREMLKN